MTAREIGCRCAWPTRRRAARNGAGSPSIENSRDEDGGHRWSQVGLTRTQEAEPSKSPVLASRLWLRRRLLIDIGHNGRDELANLLNLLLASVRDEATREGLGGEQRGPRDAFSVWVPGHSRRSRASMASSTRIWLGECGQPSAARSMRSHCAGRPGCACAGAVGGFCHRFVLPPDGIAARRDPLPADREESGLPFERRNRKRASPARTRFLADRPVASEAVILCRAGS